MTSLSRFTHPDELSVDSLQRWLVDAMVLGAAASGRIDQRQAQAIEEIVVTWPEFRGMESATLTRLLEQALHSLKTDGHLVRVHALGGALPRYAHRVLALRAAVLVACADNELASEELELFRSLQRVLGVSEADMERAFSDAQRSETSLIPEDVEPIETYLDCLLMAAASNHHLADEEWATIVAFILSVPELENVPLDSLREWMQTRLRAYSRGGIDERLEELSEESLNPVQRETAFGLAASMIASDGEIDEDESKFLAKLRIALDLDEARARIVLGRIR